MEPALVVSAFAVSSTDPMEHALVQRVGYLTLLQQPGLTHVVHPPGPPQDQDYSRSGGKIAAL